MIDAGHTVDGIPYLAMDYIDGTPIDVHADKLDLPGRLALFLQVCDAVSYAHRNLIIHRDLKPSNILVDRRDQAKLLDFGIARILEAGQDRTQTAEWQLTPEYASPEQIRGEPQTTATDIYSLGAILHRLLAGCSLTGAAQSQLRNRSRHGAEVLLAPKLPRDLEFVLRKALRQEPEERYTSVEIFAADIRAFLEGLPIRARSNDSWYRVRTFARRYRMAVAAVVLALAGLSLGLYVAHRERNIAERRFLQVRQLANQFLELDRGFRGSSGATKARNRIVTDSLAYLAGLSKESQGDRDLALEIGAAYLQAARIQGVPVDSHLGQFREAEENLRKASLFVGSVLAADPANQSALLRSAEIAHDRMILAIMQDHHQQALAAAGEMADQFELMARHGKLNPDEARRAALLSRSTAFARTYRSGLSGSAAKSDRQPGEFMAVWRYDTGGALGSGTSAVTKISAKNVMLQGEQRDTGSKAGRNVPVWVSRLPDVMGIAPFARWQPFSLAVREDGTVWTWGREISDRTDGTSDHTLPEQILALNQVVAVAGGGRHALALKADGTVWAWGYNGNGQAGDGKGLPGDGHTGTTTVPVEVSGLRAVVAIAAGGAHSLAVKADGTLWAWGFNEYGQLGNGSNADSYAPVQVPGLANVVAAVGGEHYSLALKSDGTVWAWGRNREGELGNDTNTDSNLPVWVSGLNGVISLAPASGAKHCLALKSDGTVWAWGYNASGQLGNGGATDSNVPIQVPGIRGAIEIAAGGAHSIAILEPPAGIGR